MYLLPPTSTWVMWRRFQNRSPLNVSFSSKFRMVLPLEPSRQNAFILLTSSPFSVALSSESGCRKRQFLPSAKAQPKPVMSSKPLLMYTKGQSGTDGSATAQTIAFSPPPPTVAGPRAEDSTRTSSQILWRSIMPLRAVLDISAQRPPNSCTAARPTWGTNFPFVQKLSMPSTLASRIHCAVIWLARNAKDRSDGSKVACLDSRMARRCVMFSKASAVQSPGSRCSATFFSNLRCVCNPKM
mmetsp:Transcript_64480/g.178774  ORF Transcript_64480/g.178774 Transcript_64480/m.178774 type:complete len:241 (+) Transcript_64480:2287-3009(+)